MVSQLPFKFRGDNPVTVGIFLCSPVDDWLLAYFKLNQLTPINLHIEYGVRADLCFLNNLSEFTAYFLITDDLVICNSFRKYYKYQLLGHFATSYKLHLDKHE